MSDDCTPFSKANPWFQGQGAVSTKPSEHNPLGHHNVIVRRNAALLALAETLQRFRVELQCGNDIPDMVSLTLNYADGQVITASLSTFQATPEVRSETA